MNDTVSLIVLDQQDYKENDALIYALSKEKGFLTFQAKGLRKMESKNAYACQPFSFSQFRYDEREGSGFQLLHEAILIEPNRPLRENLVKSTVASVLSETVLFMSRDGLDSEGSHELYALLDVLYKELKGNERPYLVLAFFYARVADLLGFSPMVDGCAVCASKKVDSISISDGGFVCPECRAEIQSPVYPPEVLKQFRYLAKAGLNNFDALATSISVTQDVVEIYRDFLIEHAGLRLKSWAFLEKVL